MYTFSMRPYCPSGKPNLCINFEQETSAWALSTFKKEDPILDNTNAFGLTFYSPLESIDISITQLAALIAGLDQAYADLCHALYESAPEDLAGTPWGTLQTFMECIPRGIYEQPPEITTTALTKDVKPVPFLYDKESGRKLAWTGQRWGLVDTVGDEDTCDSAGTCFGWSVLYREEDMDASCVRTPATMAQMVISLLESVAYIDSEEKVYVRNIYSVQ